jgi:hypothetical protein
MPSHGKPIQHRQMTIGEVALVLLDGANAPRLNALSMASSAIHADSEIHMYVFAATWRQHSSEAAKPLF